MNIQPDSGGLNRSRLRVALLAATVVTLAPATYLSAFPWIADQRKVGLLGFIVQRGILFAALFAVASVISYLMVVRRQTSWRRTILNLAIGPLCIIPLPVLLVVWYFSPIALLVPLALLWPAYVLLSRAFGAFPGESRFRTKP